MPSLIKLFLLLYLPAMIANGTPVVVMRGRKGHPIDFGKHFIDGKRILGDSKTIEGVLAGIVAGGVSGLLLGLLYMGEYYFENILLTSFTSSFGAMIGDLLKSFFKRRLGIESGGKMPVADQLDFYLGANLFLLVVPGAIKPNVPVFLLGLLVVPLLHVITNRLAFRAGLKKVPY
ncbi:MAG: CDP-2,3-bis-(O-geranylgeranyl)-sn-glycerol synthase [Fervidicoccaceae archaeon]